MTDEVGPDFGFAAFIGGRALFLGTADVLAVCPELLGQVKAFSNG